MAPGGNISFLKSFPKQNFNLALNIYNIHINAKINDKKNATKKTVGRKVEKKVLMKITDTNFQTKNVEMNLKVN